MVPVFNRNSKELVSNLSEQIDQGPVNVFPYTMDISLKSVCRKFPPQYAYYIRNLYSCLNLTTQCYYINFFSAFDLEIEMCSYRNFVYTIYTIVKIYYFFVVIFVSIPFYNHSMGVSSLCL